MNLLAGFTAFFLGAMHTLEPGHNKAAIAAYSVGYNSSLRHVFFLGLLTAVTHTATIFVLAWLLGATVSSTADETAHQRIEIFSASLLLLTGVWLLRRAITARKSTAHQHTTAATDCECHKSRFAADPKRPLSFGAVGLLALSSGLIPCPTALAVLLAAMSEGHLTNGLWTVCLFSIGIGLTLCIIALAAGFAAQSAWLKKRFLRFSGASRLAIYAPFLSAWIIVGSGLVMLFRAVFIG